MNSDLCRAQQLLEENAYTCVLCKGDMISTHTARGVHPLLELLDAGPWPGCSAADKVVGKAAAFLYVLLGVRAVYAAVASEAAVGVLESYGIEIICQTKVPAIFNRTRSGLCPMETAVRTIEDPQAALAAIRETLAKLAKQS